MRFASAVLTPVTVTLKVDGVNAGTNLVYASPYMAVAPGVRTVTIEPTSPSGLPAVSATVNAVAGSDSTVLLHYNSANQLSATVFSDSRVPPSGHGKGLVRFINVLGNRNDPLRLFVNSQLIGQATPGQATAYVELPAGVYSAEVRDPSNTLVLTGTLTLVQGDHRALVASSQVAKDESNNDVAIANLNELVEVAHTALTFKEFLIDQAPVGTWQVKLVGDTSIPTWRGRAQRRQPAGDQQLRSAATPRRPAYGGSLAPFAVGLCADEDHLLCGAGADHGDRHHDRRQRRRRPADDPAVPRRRSGKH